MQMPLFGSTFGLTSADPVGLRLVKYIRLRLGEQHIHYISERAQGRQPKKGKSENNFGGAKFDRGIGQNLG
jgi:hypothetical protein